MADPINQDEDAFFNKYHPNVSEDDFFTKYDPLKAKQGEFFNQGPYSGKESDSYFSGSSVGRILSAFGQDASNSWGAYPDTALKNEFKWEGEHKDEDHSISYGLHTAWARPLAAAIDAVSTIPRGAFALGSGVAEATGQLSHELNTAGEEINQANAGRTLSIDTPWQQINLSPGTLLTAPLGYGEEVAKGISGGAGLEGHYNYSDLGQRIFEARAKGIIGEGERGFYNTSKPTPEQMEARNTAAAQAGYGPETVEQWQAVRTVPTTRELARQIDPDLFSEVDRLQEEKDALQASIQNELIKAREETEKLAAQQGVEVEGIKPSPALKKTLSGVQELQKRALETDASLRDTIEPQRAAEDRSEELLTSQSPEGDAYRNKIQADALEAAVNAIPADQESYWAWKRIAADKMAENQSKIDKAYKDAHGLQDDGKPKTTDTKSEPGSPLTKTPSAAQQILETDGPRTVSPNKETGTANQIEIEAAEKGLASYLPDKAMFESMKGQIPKALEFVKANYEQAKRIISGIAKPPEDLHPAAILNALKQEVFARGDTEAIPDLARSKYNRQVSEAGQTLGMVRGMFDDLDPDKILQHIEDSWKEKNKTDIDKTLAEIQKSQKEATEKFSADYESFLNIIECK